MALWGYILDLNLGEALLTAIIVLPQNSISIRLGVSGWLLLGTIDWTSPCTICQSRWHIGSGIHRSLPVWISSFARPHGSAGNPVWLIRGTPPGVLCPVSELPALKIIISGVVNVQLISRRSCSSLRRDPIHIWCSIHLPSSSGWSTGGITIHCVCQAATPRHSEGCYLTLMSWFLAAPFHYENSQPDSSIIDPHS